MNGVMKAVRTEAPQHSGELGPRASLSFGAPGGREQPGGGFAPSGPGGSSAWPSLDGKFTG